MSVSPLIVKYEKTLARNPRSQVFAHLSELYRKIGLMEKSREVLQNGIRYNPDYIPGYIELANYYSELREYQLAHATIRPLINSNRDNIKLLKLFVKCCSELDYKNEALDTLKYLLFLNPKDKEIAKKINVLEKDETPIIERSDDEAIRFDIDSLNSKDVEEDYGNWVEVNTASKVEEDSLALEWSIENHGSPVIDNEKVDPPVANPRVNHALVDIYIEQGHIERAKDVLEKILLIQPDDEDAQIRIKEIEGLLTVDSDEVDDDLEDKIETQDSDFNTGSLMEVFDKKVVQSGPQDIEKVGERLDQFLDALRVRGNMDSQL